MAIKIPSVLPRDLVVLNDELNPESSDIVTIYPSTTLDQVFDNKTASNKTLRSIIEDLKADIATGGRGNIVFPVTSVNGKTGNVVLDKSSINLNNVDNTSDDQKPLSTPQRIAIAEILANYDFHIDLTRFENHLINMNNPHGVTLDQLNTHGELTDAIDERIRRHNIDSTSHADIRSKLAELDSTIIDTEQTVEQIVGGAMREFENHNIDPNAHMEMFASKESLDNKVEEIGLYDHVTYPTTRAVVEYVANKLIEFEDKIPSIRRIEDILFVDRRNDLPPANELVYQKAYVIRYGIGNHPELAICRFNPSGGYDWEISTMSTFSKFDDKYFVESIDGLSIKITPIAEKILEDDTIIESIREQLERLMPGVMSNYYTKTEIDNFSFIKSIHMQPGTQYGTIRYYVNNDERTMSEDIHVQGLQRLAYLEWVTENELADQSVRSNHITDRSIEHRHMANKAVSYKNMQATHMTMLGNLEDQDNRTVQEITIPELAYTLNPYIDSGAGDGRFTILTDDEVLSIVGKAYRGQNGWIDPELCVTVILRADGSLIIEYDHDEPNVWIDDGYLYLNWNNTCTDNALLRFHFRIDENGDLIVDYCAVDPTKPAAFVPVNSNMIVEYTETCPAPQLTFDDDGNCILISYDSECDAELEKYRFIETSDGDIIMYYDWPDQGDRTATFDIIKNDLILTYDETSGQPEAWIEMPGGYLMLNSYDGENDNELSRYMFKINSEGELEAIYLDEIPD